MNRKVVASLCAAVAVLALEATTQSASAQPRRRVLPEVRLTRPSWLVSPNVPFEVPENYNSYRPDMVFAPYHATGEFIAMSTSMRGVPGPDIFGLGPPFPVQWPWPASFFDPHGR
jgi:hypothetical protein